LVFIAATSEPHRKCHSDRVLAGQDRARHRDLGDLVFGETQQRQVSAGAAIFLRHPLLKQAHITKDRNQLLGKAIALVDFGRDRRDVPIDHFLDAVDERGLLFGQVHGGFLGRFL
jgi:hypothetical protein